MNTYTQLKIKVVRKQALDQARLDMDVAKEEDDQNSYAVFAAMYDLLYMAYKGVDLPNSVVMMLKEEYQQYVELE